MRGKAILVARTRCRSISGGRSLPSFQSPVLQEESEAEDKRCDNPEGWGARCGYGIEADGDRLVFAGVYRPGKINADAHWQDNCSYEHCKQACEYTFPQNHGINP